MKSSDLYLNPSNNQQIDLVKEEIDKQIITKIFFIENDEAIKDLYLLPSDTK